MFTFLLCSFSLSRFHSAVPVTDNDILMTRQEYGQTNRDRSVDGNKLTIAGVQYETGIGTHAVSMIPMTVPDNAIRFQGACGVDDEEIVVRVVPFDELPSLGIDGATAAATFLIQSYLATKQ